MSFVILILLLFTRELQPVQCSADVLSIHVDKNGADTAECLEGKKSCLTVNYVLTKLQNMDNDTPPVEITVSTSEQKLPHEAGVYDINFSSLTIVGVGDVTFSGLFGMMLKPNRSVYVHIKGIKFENSRPAKPPFINPELYFTDAETLIFEDCTVHYGSSLFARVQNLTIDNCIFSEFSSSSLPVIFFWAMDPDSIFSKSTRKSLPISTEQNSKLGSIVVRNSVIANNSGTFIGPAYDYPGPGFMCIDVSGLPELVQDFQITHYDILVENCTFTNNSFTGRITPLLQTYYTPDINSSFSADFNLVNSNFINNSITTKDSKDDVLTLLSVTYNINTSFSFTVNECSFINNSFCPSVMLGDLIQVNVELNVLDSVFQSSGLPQRLQVIEDLGDSSTNKVTTNISGNKFV